MRFRHWATRVILIFLMLATLILAMFIGGARKQPNNTGISNPNPIIWNQYPQALYQSEKTAEKPPITLPKLPILSKSFVERKPKNQVITQYITTAAFAGYKPNLAAAKVHPSNYGERFTHDVNGVPVNNQPLIVLHETTNSASSAVNFFQNNNVDENVQASYHALITLDGTVIYLVAPDKRAFGAGNSVFKAANGVEETVQTNPNLSPSVNNFAYHVSLETPPDAWGKRNIQGHSGYTEDQYNSLAWLIAQSQVPDERITTHRDVDIANGKVDPLSFDFEKFFNKLHSFRELRSFNNS
ncbi:N-acetylmuramyl-L-alanine amidase, negative regulator of AmpC, AmpD [Sphaerospermopsis reniformis]|uniref:N-acetylmuramoyl-L-alanine amidase n=1 Tax=Sphaerospermopsis reniformis TaxID=531300 RepID=A0A480A2K1_9CYAN|nr:peptidoglycan recognition family protein [Sphaerospermopsis reniformis]GCL39087.1 N-acetylmuramyl-L-alanine amidase, negative regulator of AmpC, AmpD [Sphaerospermopsis reniformis]